MDKKILRSRLECLECGDILESVDRHDCVTCGCPNETMLDGGREYLRYGAVDMDKIKLITEYVDKDTFIWGVLDRETYEYVYKDIRTLEDSHVQNIALHLRNRYKNHEHASARRLKFEIDQRTLKANILPELGRRGLEEVTEEIPYG